MSTKTITHTLEYQKSTKGAHVYGDAKITGFYIPKDEIAQLAEGVPEKIVLTIEISNGNGKH